MIININDKTNSAKMLYYQSLVLLFMPCEKFTKNDTDSQMNVYAYIENETLFSNIKLCVLGKESNVSSCEKIDSSKKNQMKNLIGRCILDAFYEIFKIRAPWGISTGVKPLKLARGFISEFGEDVARQILENDYSISREKVDLCIEGAKKERGILEKFPENPFSLYISIPFCPTRCSYCSFVSCTTPRLLSLIPQYLEKLKQDICDISKCTKDIGLNLCSVYFGGGTPAILDEKQINGLLKCVYENFDINNDIEVTFEAGRPDCITKEKLLVLNGFGVSRISINPQTTNDETLKFIGRNHTTKMFYDAFGMAKSVGFDSINCDLISSLPSDTLESFEKSLDDVIALCPENITVHSFTLKKSSDFTVSGNTDFVKEYKLANDMCNLAYQKINENGYFPYYVYRQKNTAGNLENTGYSVSGRECKYNIVMMGEYHTVLSAGAGAVTKLVNPKTLNVDRIFAPKYPYEYLDKEKYSGFDAKSVSDFYSNL